MEKREEIRKKYHKIIKINGISARIEDISEKGMNVHIAKRPESEIIEIDFGTFKINGKIRWIITKSYGQPLQIGINFIEITQDLLEFILNEV